MKNSFPKVVFIVGFLFVSIFENGNAQPYIDAFNSKLQFFPSSKYANNSEEKLKVFEQEIALNYGIIRKNSDVIILGGYFNHLGFFTYSGNQASLIGASLILGYNMNLKNTKWSGDFLFIPKLNSDYENTSIDDILLSGIASFSYEFCKKIKLGAGYYCNREYYGNASYPFAKLDLRIKKFNLFGDIPFNLNIEYQLSEKLRGGIAALTLLSSYRTSSSTFGKGYVIEGDKTYVGLLKLVLHYYFKSPGMVIYAEGGHTFHRKYQFYNNKNIFQTTHPIFNNTPNGLLFNVGLAYRLPN